MTRVMQAVGTDIIRLVGGGEDERLRTGAANNIERVATEASFEEHPQPGPTTPSLAELAPRVDIPGLLRLVRSARMEDLELARDQALIFRTFARSFAPTMERRFGPARAFPWKLIGSARDQAIAYAVPALVLLRRVRGARLDDTIRFLADWTPFFQAANLVVDELPPDLQLLGCDGGVESLSLRQREDLKLHLRRISRTHPAEFSLVENPPEIPEIMG
jgi:hypothetical protein